MAIVFSVVLFLCYVGVVLILARFVIDWVQFFAQQWRPRGVIAVLAEGIYSITDPPLRAIRGVVPPIRLGQVMLDLAPLLLLIALYILIAITRGLAAATV